MTDTTTSDVLADTLATYQRVSRATAIYPGHDEQPSPAGITYNSLALIGEAGEIAGKVSKIRRDRLNIDDIRPGLLAECGDVLWHLAQLATDWGFSLGDVAGEVDAGPATFSLRQLADLEHAAICLAGDSWEVAVEADGLDDMETVRARASVLCDFPAVVQSLMLVIHALDGNLVAVAQANIDKLNSRKQRGVLGGNGDNR